MWWRRGRHTADVPKAQFDFAKVSGESSFGAEGSTGDEGPLFWLASRSNSLTGARTPREIAERNQHGDLAIVSLRLER